MCGIGGFVGGKWSGRAQAAAIAAHMGRTILHRGPDHSDVWIDEEARVAFAHNRLAILDLSAAGNQPMASHSGRYVLVYNGEIYNHLQVRDELAEAGLAPNWNGHSDTETLLAATEAWGVRGALERSTGMFALALWDKAERTLTLARDRLGEKPLYFGRQEAGGPFLFGSELKALSPHPQFRADIDRQALTLLLRYNYIPAPFSIYRGISKLPPGAILTLRDGASAPEIEQYWSAAAVAEAGASDPLELGDEEAIDELERHLEAAIGRQMIADVPLGAFLSGGIDSSMVVALMQRLSPRPVKTFTIGFHEAGYNEAEHAKAVARHLGTDHTELYVTPAETQAVIPALPQMYDEIVITETRGVMPAPLCLVPGAATISHAAQLRTAAGADKGEAPASRPGGSAGRNAAVSVPDNPRTIRGRSAVLRRQFPLSRPWRCRTGREADSRATRSRRNRPSRGGRVSGKTLGLHTGNAAPRTPPRTRR
jgi:asparagine synthase (glutamine-hydrolysing)